MRGPHLTFFPQFCREPLNDIAWYPGFNDWDLIRNLPGGMRDRFRPAAGFYDLGSGADIALQFQSMAKSGWQAMALYQYFFDGKFALDGVEKFILASAENVPKFFVIWANESWSKRWVGKANEFIIRQTYSLEKHIIRAHVNRLCQLFAHSAYQHWNGRPVFVLYSAYDVPNLPEVLATYRAAFRSEGVDPLFGFCASYVDLNFNAQQFEFCLEFQPRLFFNTMRQQATPTTARAALALKRVAPSLYDALVGMRERRTRRRMAPRESFRYSDYLHMLEQDLFGRLLQQAYGIPVVRCLFYSWNNFPRYRGSSVVVTHAKSDHEQFLKIVEQWTTTDAWFLVNSWNEWSEGAALEPGAQSPLSFDLVNSSTAGS